MTRSRGKGDGYYTRMRGVGRGGSIDVNGPFRVLRMVL